MKKENKALLKLLIVYAVLSILVLWAEVLYSGMSPYIMIFVVFTMIISIYLVSHGKRILKELYEEFYDHVKADGARFRLPYFKMIGCVTLMNAPLYFVWLCGAAFVVLVGPMSLLFFGVPVTIISAVRFIPLYDKWKELDGSRIGYWGFQAGLYFLIFGGSVVCYLLFGST